MKAGVKQLVSQPGLTALLLAMTFSFGCASQAKSTAVRDGDDPRQESEQATEFVGTPIMGDYDEDEDLDFVLEVNEDGRVFKVDIHEEAGEGNRDILDRIRRRINSMEDRGSLRVVGYYSPEYRGGDREYGFMDLKTVIFFEDETGLEEAFFTDPKGSRFYDDGDVTVVYAPGHHLSCIYYPRYVTPWWDGDGDGIPDRYDPWPFTYDIWYDYNLNYVPDWYDPFYVSHYPYWNHWRAGFWVDYGWYGPSYFHGHHWYSRDYYDNYRTYTRLYDRRVVSRLDRNNYRLDLRTEGRYRDRYAGIPRATDRSSESRSRDFYNSNPPDRRRLAPVNGGGRGADESATALTENSGSRSYRDNGNRARNTGSVASGSDFDRSRGTDARTIDSGRSRRTAAAVADNSGSKRRSEPASAGQTGRGSITRERSDSGREIPRGDRSLSRGRSGDDRTLTPISRNRDESGSSGSTTSPAATGRGSYDRGGSDRSRGSSATTPSRGSSVNRGGSSRDRGSSQPAARPAPSSSGSRPAASPAPSGSRGRATPAPSSGGGSRSSGGDRSRSSSGSSGSSGGGRTRR